MFDRNETLAEARERNVRDALFEDLGRGDWTGRLIPAGRRAAAVVVVRECAVLCGREWFDGCIMALDGGARIEWRIAEGGEMQAGDVVCRVEAEARALLSAERSALNFLQLLSGTATVARQHVQALREESTPRADPHAGEPPAPREDEAAAEPAAHSGMPGACLVLDTRKTLPGLRQAQKYAVRIGGGANQRLALWDGILIKENHIAAAGGIAAALDAARALAARVPVQIEVETLGQLAEALAAGATRVLLDNFPLDAMREAVSLAAGRALLEASGGIGLDRLREVAATGVDRISIGRLTKDVKAVDFSLRIEGR